MEFLQEHCCVGLQFAHSKYCIKVYEYHVYSQSWKKAFQKFTELFTILPVYVVVQINNNQS